MSIETIIAQIWSVYFIIITTWILTQRKRIEVLLKKIVKNVEINFVFAFITLGLGIVLVINYSYWTFDWKLGLTIVHWITLLKGLMLLFFPAYMISISVKMIKNNMAYIISGMLNFMLALYFGYYGFIAQNNQSSWSLFG